MDIFDKFLNIIKVFEDEQVEYVLIGGYAIILHGFLRATQDIDFFVNPTDDNITKLQTALKKLYADETISEITAAELMKYPVIRYGTEDGFSIDFIARIGEKFQFLDICYEVKEINDYKIRVATPKILYELKKNTYREIDQIDLKFLERKMKNDAG